MKVLWVLADYPYYTDYTYYNSVYAPAAVANLSRATGNQRTWDPAGPFTVTLETSLGILLPYLDFTHPPTVQTERNL